jgi:hypothetical protein
MITTVEEGVSLYKDEVKDYLRWAKDNMKMDAERNHSTALIRNAKIQGMEKVLGLKPGEATRIVEKCREEIGLPA